MRQKFIEEDGSVYFMVIEWGGLDNAVQKLSWLDFKQSVIGHTDPRLADPHSLRGKVYSDWRSLNLKRAPDIIENAVHGSSSAYESMLERTAWLKLPIFLDPLSIAFLSAGVSTQSVTDWMMNPQIKGMPVFDHFDGLGFDESVAKASELYKSISKASRAVRLSSIHGVNLRAIVPREPVKLTAFGTGSRFALINLPTHNILLKSK